MELVYDLRNAKKCLFSQLETVSSLYHLSEERVKVKRTLDMAFQHKLSTSLIMVGGSGDEAVNLVRSVLETYKSQDFQSSLGDRYTKGKNYTARVNGSLHGNDHEALADLANQFLVRSEREMAGSTLALEDLEDHFRQCRLDGIPAIIVIEDFHVFTKRKRQTLIYALLDLMHKKDLLFTIVGITDHSDVETRLEKRVVSRLNAQYVFMSKPRGAEVCEFLYNACTLPLPEEGAAGADRSTGGVSTAFGVQFNAKTKALFGAYDCTVVEETARSAEAGTEEVKQGPRFLPGAMRDAFDMHCDWGRDMSYFVRAGLRAVCSLHAEQPFLTAEVLQSALASLEPENVDDLLAGLSALELQLFIAVLHEHGRNQQGGGGGGAAASGGALNVSSRPLVMLVSRVLLLCDMLVEVFKQKSVPVCRVIQALAGLAQKGLIFMVNAVPGKMSMPVSTLSLGTHGTELSGSAGSICSSTFVMLNVSYEQAIDAFRVKKAGSAGASDPRLVGRPKPVLQINERLRRAVLEPLVPVVYQSGGGVGSGLSLSAQQTLTDGLKRKSIT